MPIDNITNNGILINAQIGIFFANKVDRPDKEIWNRIEDVLAFNTPTMVPVPDDSQLWDVPVVQASISATDTANAIQVSIARNRMDITILGKGEQTYSSIEDQLLKVCEKIIDKTNDTVKVKRVGLIVRSFFEVANPKTELIKLISTKLANKQDKNNPVETFVRYVTREEISNLDLKINNFTEYQYFNARVVGTDRIERDGILLIRDINTSPDDDYSSQLDPAKIMDFIKAAKSLLKFPDYKIWA